MSACVSGTLGEVHLLFAENLLPPGGSCPGAPGVVLLGFPVFGFGSSPVFLAACTSCWVAASTPSVPARLDWTEAFEGGDVCRWPDSSASVERFGQLAESMGLSYDTEPSKWKTTQLPTYNREREVFTIRSVSRLWLVLTWTCCCHPGILIKPNIKPRCWGSRTCWQDKVRGESQRSER